MFEDLEIIFDGFKLPTQSILKSILTIVWVLFIGHISTKLLLKVNQNFFKKAYKKMSEKKKNTLCSVISSAIKYVIKFISIFHILVALGIDSVSILAALSVFSVAIGLGTQTFVKDIITGFFILLEDQFAVGDHVILENTKYGLVENMGLRTTSIRSPEGYLHIIPNSEIRSITNMSKDFNVAIIDIISKSNTNLKKLLENFEKEIKVQKTLISSILDTPHVLGITKLNDEKVEIRISIKCAVGKKDEIERTLRLCLLEVIKNNYL